MSEWKSIETAPKDRAVMLFIPDGSDNITPDTPLCYFDPFYERNGDGWVICYAGEELRLHFTDKPTHWMPLPEPPKL